MEKTRHGDVVFQFTSLGLNKGPPCFDFPFISGFVGHPVCFSLFGFKWVLFSLPSNFIVFQDFYVPVKGSQEALCARCQVRVLCV